MDLAKINNLNINSVLKIGQVLTIPSSSGTNFNTTFNYTVKKGDSLYSIAKKYNTTVDVLKKLNNLTSNNLSINQILKIPENYDSQVSLPNYINYIVKKGDSLYSIAKKYNLTVDQIIKDNNLSSNILQIGDNLKIRVDEEIIEECIGPDFNIDTTYTVKKGDSLYSIAKKYNTTVDIIKSKNNLKNNLLSIGQILKI